MPANDGLSDWDLVLHKADGLRPDALAAGSVFDHLLKLLIESESTSTIGMSLARLGQQTWIQRQQDRGLGIADNELRRHAIALLEAGLALEPAQGLMWMHLGNLRSFQWDWARAAEAYERHLEDEPEDTETRAKLANAYWNMLRASAARKEATRALNEADLSTARGALSRDLATIVLNKIEEFEQADR